MALGSAAEALQLDEYSKRSLWFHHYIRESRENITLYLLSGIGFMPTVHGNCLYILVDENVTSVVKVRVANNQSKPD
jgi:hypothetical protein